MIIPMVYPVFKREVSNSMYSPTPFFFARVLISAVTFVLYPIMVTLTVIWFLGMPTVGITGFLHFLGILSLMAFVGSALGFSLGAIFPNAFSALNVNQMVIIIFSFGAGMYANTGTSANFLVKFISWVSPLHYSCELLLRLLFEGKNEEFVE
jgi:ABC-type multidrug transport system permease subunit